MRLRQGARPFKSGVRMLHCLRVNGVRAPREPRHHHTEAKRRHLARTDSVPTVLEQYCRNTVDYVGVNTSEQNAKPKHGIVFGPR